MTQTLMTEGIMRFASFEISSMKVNCPTSSFLSLLNKLTSRSLSRVCHIDISSFVNTIVHRSPKEEALFRGQNRCNCHSLLKQSDNDEYSLCSSPSSLNIDWRFVRVLLIRMIEMLLIIQLDLKTTIETNEEKVSK